MVGGWNNHVSAILIRKPQQTCVKILCSHCCSSLCRFMASIKEILQYQCTSIVCVTCDLIYDHSLWNIWRTFYNITVFLCNDLPNIHLQWPIIGPDNTELHCIGCSSLSTSAEFDRLFFIWSVFIQTCFCRP